MQNMTCPPASRAGAPLALLLAVALLAACGAELPAGSDQELPVPASWSWLAPDTLDTDPPLEVVAHGLETPWALAFAPDGRIFVTERPGRIRIVQHSRMRVEPWAVTRTDELSEAGLLGIALDPDFERNGHVYVFSTYIRPRTLTRPIRGMVARIVRYTDMEGVGRNPVVIRDGLPSHQLHAGGALGFGPDGMLYATIGDVFDQPSAQDSRSWSGAVLRLNADGTIPADNPDPRSPVYARGLRNVQGLAWLPDRGSLLAIEHGPTGLLEEQHRLHADELNAIRAGGNYGWPEVIGNVEDERFDAPLIEWTPAIAPAGLAIGPATSMPASGFNVYVAALRGRELRRLHLVESSSGLRVESDEALFTQAFGRLRAVGISPAGELYFGTSNRDGRGTPEEVDDRIFRMLRQ
jgi:aldose sugar dehydrogenase